MYYRIFDKDKMKGLNNNQAYVFGRFSFKSNYKTGESKVKQKTLAQLCGCSESKIQDCITVFTDKGLILSTKTRKYLDKDNQPRRANIYELYVPDKENTNYFTVTKEFFELDIPDKILGYVLLLKCICLNGTNDCFYNLTEISTHLNIGYSTLKGKNGLHQKAIDYGLIEDEKVIYKEKKVIRHTIVTPYILTAQKVNLPDLNSRLGRFEKENLEGYNYIRRLCSELGVEPPPYNKKMMGRMLAFARGKQLYKVLKDRIKSIKGDKVTSLLYFIKVLGIEPIEKIDMYSDIIIL